MWWSATRASADKRRIAISLRPISSEKKTLGSPLPAFQVVLHASLEVRSAVVCASLIVTLVFLPVLFLDGLSGSFFRPLAIAYILAILASLIVALTVTPALSLMLLPGAGERRHDAPLKGLLKRLYGAVLPLFMNRPKSALLVIVGMLMGVSMIMVRVKSPMLVAVGMYLPLETTFAIFVGGVIRWLTDQLRDRRGFNEAQKTRIDNVGILAASGLIAGEAMTGLVTATCNYFNIPLPSIFQDPSYLVGLVFMALIAFVLVRVPLANAGRPDEPAPPAAMM